MNLFQFTGAGKIVFGNGALSALPEHVQALRSKNPLIVLDQGLADTELRGRVEETLKGAALSFAVFDRVVAEPPLSLADEGAALALEGCHDAVVGIGGGSAMDVAKAVAACAANRGKAADYLGLNRVPGPGLPTVMIPTTAGTGSEVTFTAVFLRPELKKKEGMNSPYLYPNCALLDPTLTLSLPPAPTATTGMDALCHAIESYTSVQASVMSRLFSLEAVRRISGHLRTGVHNGANPAAREELLLGSLYAGLGLANAGVTAVHSLSYPLGGRYGVPHGLANTILLPAVMAFNLPGAPEAFGVLAAALGECTEGLSVREAATLAVAAVESLIQDCGIPALRESYRIPAEDFPALAEVAMTVARPLANNPRRVTPADAVAIYREALC